MDTALNKAVALILIGNAAGTAGVFTIMWWLDRVYVFEPNLWIRGLETGLAWASLVFGFWYLFRRA